MSKHKHKWRRITRTESTHYQLEVGEHWWCSRGKCARVAKWTCGEASILAGDKCQHGRCAAHGPKPRKVEKAKPERIAWTVYGVGDMAALEALGKACGWRVERKGRR
jgi:hypothetical protein